MIRKMTIFLALKNPIDEDNSSNVNSVLGLDNDTTLIILGQERNDFWSHPDYILFRYEKISNIHLKDDFLKYILWNSIKEFSNDCYNQKSFYGIQAKVFYFIKPLIYILESSEDDETSLKCLQSYPFIQKFLFGVNFDKSSEKFIKELPITHICEIS